MRKFCKVLALIMAVLVLVTMATACKSGDDDEWDNVDVSGDVFDDESNDSKDDDDSENGNSTDKNTENDKNTNTDKGNSSDKDSGLDKDTNTDQKPSTDANTDGENKDHQQVVDDYDEDDKYVVQANPLLAESKKVNTGILPSYDIDTTGFVKNNVKLADLKGKSLVFITAESQGSFFYNDANGAKIDEWEWFELLKGELGLTVKYTKSHWHQSMSTALTYMNAGKALDLIPTSIGGFPQFLNLSQGLNPYINLQNIGNSPGVDEMTFEETEYGGQYRCIAPIGAVDVLIYNQSLVEELNLKDPHTMWQNDEWDWNAWRAFLTSVPTNTTDGKKLFAYRQGIGSWWTTFPLSNGVAPIALDHENKEPNLINNWMNDSVVEAVTFFADTMKSVNDCISSDDGETLKTEESYCRLFKDGTLMMGNRVWLAGDYDQFDYARTRKYNWVPYPKAPGANGRYVAYNFGYTMMIPRVVKNKNNIPYAVKFAELWANRCTEAVFDYLAIKPHINFTYAQQKEYFEFCIKNTYFGLEMTSFRMMTGAISDAFRKAQEGYIYAGYNSNLNAATKHKEVANLVADAIKETLEYGGA